MKKLLIFAFVLLLAFSALAAEDSITYTIENGVLTVSGSGVCEKLPLTDEQWKTIERIVITEGITEIGDWAFDGYLKQNKVYTSVTLPEGLTRIGYAAFAFAETLTDINLPSTLTEIGYGAFNETAIKDITIPSGVIKISDALFNGSELESITLPETLIEIGQFAFQHTKLDKIELPPSLKIIGPSAFAHCYNLKKISLPEGVTKIHSFAFYECTALEEIYLPTSLETIENSAFRYTPLLHIYLNEANEHFCIENDILFSKDKKTLVRYPAYKTETSYTVPNYVEHLYAEAFLGCTFDELILPEGLKSVGGMAFGECENLKTITIPSSVEYTGSVITGNGCPDFYGVGAYSVGAFHCSNFEEITVLSNKVDVARDGWPFHSFTSDLTIYCNRYSATDLGARELAGEIPVKISYLDNDHEHVDIEEILREPTCTAVGEKRYTCTVCGYMRTVSIDKLPHTYIETFEPSTCYSEGTRTFSCEVCGTFTWSDPVPKAEHSFGEEEIMTEDCTKGYVSNKKCTVCGRLVTEELEGGEHIFSEWKTVREASLKESGEEKRECSV